MDRMEAIAAFTTLHSMTTTIEGDPTAEVVRGREGYDEPLFDVRLDAGSAKDLWDRVERSWRIRVTPSSTEWADENAMRKVFDLAEEAGLTAVIGNSGIELT